jgi:RimJ/RimL family protein N-acetyltransferase
VWAWIEEFRDRIADDFAPQTLDEFVDQWVAENGSRKTWGVWRADDLGGLVIWQPDPRIPGIGTTHAVFKKTFWGRATTRPALAEIYTELFGSGVRKIQALPFRSNNAIIALAKSGGARTEGILERHTMRRGKLVDVVILALFKEDFQRCLSLHPSEERLRAASAPPAERSPAASVPQREPSDQVDS